MGIKRYELNEAQWARIALLVLYGHPQTDLTWPFPLPEWFIAADPGYFFGHASDGQIMVAGAADERVVVEYRRCYADPASRHAICEDYRAATYIDLEHDEIDADVRLAMPLLVLWVSPDLRAQQSRTDGFEHHSAM